MFFWARDQLSDFGEITAAQEQKQARRPVSAPVAVAVFEFRTDLFKFMDVNAGQVLSATAYLFQLQKKI